MTLTPAQQIELRDLIDAVCEAGPTSPATERLESLLLADDDACRYYLDYTYLHGALMLAAEPSGNEERGTKNEERNDDRKTAQIDRGLGALVPSGAPIAFPTPDFSVPHSSFLIPTSSPFLGDVLFSYLMATLILGTVLAIAGAWKLSAPVQFVRQPVSLPSPLSPLPSMVGRITGMVDCQWSDPNTAAPGLVAVSLGRKYALSSGLMEITYSAGAKVILQGPCTYEVESAAGGYLSVGKLTARMETKEERRTKNEELPGSNSSFLIPHSYFAVRTPTAIVTDLGTEFGVEVSKQGSTTSHVFRGSVRLQPSSADGTTESVACVLHENESARVNSDNGNRITVLGASSMTIRFVREIPKGTVKTLDLVDVVAGGDGFSGRRNRGINPATGRISTAQPSSPDLTGNHQYHRVEGIPFVDGVFIPDGSKGPVQVDSAGNTFDSFFKTSNIGYGYVWAGESVVYVGASTLGGVDYASPGHGALFLHANKGITFDLQAIRRANPGCNLLRFRATAGNTETISMNGYGVFADFWVLVDGQVRFRRREINGSSGAFSVVVPIQQKDCFLTLAATDGGNGIAADQIIFGDPRLELTPVESEYRSALQPE